MDKLLDPEGKYIKLSFLALALERIQAAGGQPGHLRSFVDEFRLRGRTRGGRGENQAAARRPDVAAAELRDLSLHAGNQMPGRRRQTPSGSRCTTGQDRRGAQSDSGAGEAPARRTKQAFEGYRNPLFLFARAPETDVPNKNAPGTLVVRPGQSCCVEDFAKAKVIYFEPGVHDYSQFNAADPDHYITLQHGTDRLSGRAAPMSMAFSAPTSAGPPSVRWPCFADAEPCRARSSAGRTCLTVTTLEKGVRMDGIQITDPHNHISHSTAPVKDVAVVGAWHGNTDGFTREVPASEPYRAGISTTASSWRRTRT